MSDISPYYERKSTTHTDGTPLFQTRGDDRNEAEIARMIEAQWNCNLHRFGKLVAIDWYAVRHERLEALIELKARTHDATRYPTVFLNARKWIALTLASLGMGVPAVFVVRFADGVRWIRLDRVDATQHRIAGCSRLVKSHSDIEPIIEVPVPAMRLLAAEVAA